MTLVAALVFWAQAAVPPPQEQLQANCAAPAYATDMLVCDDYDLRARDAEMGAMLTQLDATPVTGLPPLIEPQAEWFKRRSRCAFKENHRQCTADAYEERTILLRTLLEPDGAEAPRYRCAASWLPEGAEARILRKRALVIWSKGKRIGVAMQRFEHSDWRPYALLEGTFEQPEVVGSGTSKMKCIGISH
ncbi:hypothetical protein D3876_17265 [Sphingomonas cavernae]|uniref:DUF1311 domain-containing protein n=2 Tax=Sphingomonas cavernae TaxID=2320861 RepID=A0A418W6J2_9SPHN|nr:hypothetical protein D3876_17265 [Sphingomonas cavernae]